MSILVSPTELDRMRRDGVVRILDVRWRLDAPDGRPAFRDSHVPGAVFVDLEAELARRGAPIDGRHPLPALPDLEESARSWGIDAGDTVVVYDDAANQSAARAWWLLRWAGLDDVRLLDGGLGAWSAAGLPLESGEPGIRRGGVALWSGARPTIDADQAATFPGVLLDARAGARFRGEIEPLDPRAGHIPGAVSAPTVENVDADGRFLSPDALRERFAALGVTAGVPVAVYCGSGITAAHEAVALELAGFAPALFPGSWSAWSNDPARPVATGR